MYDAILWFMFAYLLYIYMCDKYSTVWRQILKFEIKKIITQAAHRVSRLWKMGFHRRLTKWAACVN